MCGQLSRKFGAKNTKSDYLRCNNAYMCDRHVRIWLSNRLMKKRIMDEQPYFGRERKSRRNRQPPEIFARKMQAWGSPNARLIDQINLVYVYSHLYTVCRVDICVYLERWIGMSWSPNIFLVDVIFFNPCIS